MDTTRNEGTYLLGISEKLTKTQAFLDANPVENLPLDGKNWYDYLVSIKRILGNFDNDVTFVACLMAKEFLASRHELPALDTAAKAQSAPGLDIDELTSSGNRIIAEVKTTIPYLERDLGSQQRDALLKDCSKLANNDAAFKYFFVTEALMFEIVKKKYADRLPGVSIVLLPQALQGNPEDFVVMVPSPDIKHPKSKTDVPTKSPSPSFHTLADNIREFIRDNYVAPQRKAGKPQITIRSGDVHNRMGLKNRYAAVCGAMNSSQIEGECHVRIEEVNGTAGANLLVTHELLTMKDRQMGI